jgi:hypothetical protein
MSETRVLIALVLTLVLPLAVAIILPFILSGEAWKAAQEKARARRLVDANMNARLLRFNL